MSRRRFRAGRRLRSLAAALAVASSAASVAGCGGGSSPSVAPAATPTAADVSVIQSPRQTVSFVEVGHAVDRLYARHPDLRSFVVRDVQYTTRTRDKVLSVCHRGGPEKSRARRETIRLAGCAPLVFFFSSYGRQHAVPEATDVARKIYWYAVRDIRGPIDSRVTLTALLRNWGVE